MEVLASKGCPNSRLLDDVIHEVVNDSDSDEYEVALNAEDLEFIESTPTIPEFLDDPDDLENDIFQELHATQSQPQVKKRKVVKHTDLELGWADSRSEVKKPVFSGVAGLKFGVKEGSPYEYFSLFFTDEIWELIRNETNKYAEQQINIKTERGEMKKKSLLALWKPVSVQELKLFFATVIHMCVVQKPYIRDYWRTEPIIRTNYATSIGMTRDRFKAILTMFHINDNDHRIPRGQPGYESLYKIKPVLNLLTAKFQTAYSPDEVLTIHEAICAFPVRVNVQVYVNGKPCKYGIKVFELCDAKTGYVCNLDVCAGTHRTIQDFVNSFHVVDRLCEPIKNKGHTVYMDQWFTSPTLLDHLWSFKTKAVGNVMQNLEEMPQEAFSRKLRKGERIIAYRNHLLATKWCDDGEVIMLSSAHEDKIVDARDSKGVHDKLKPVTVVDFNKHKLGVDKSKQMLACYSFKRKSVKWWKKLFFYLFDLTLLNSYILHSRKAKQEVKLNQFIEKVAEGLVSNAGTVLVEQPQASTAGRLVGRGHFSYKLPLSSSGTGHASTRRRCKVCADKGKHRTGKAALKFTSVFCPVCDVGLCLGECFELYHSKLNYWE